MSDDQNTKAAEYMYELCNRTGVAVSTVKDGTVLLFSRQFLKELIEKDPGKEKLCIFVKKPTVQ